MTNDELAFRLPSFVFCSAERSKPLEEMLAHVRAFIEEHDPNISDSRTVSGIWRPRQDGCSIASESGFWVSSTRAWNMSLEEAKMNWIKVLSQSELADGERKVVPVGQHSLLLIHHEGQFYALDSRCPHMRLPLKGAKVEGATLTCPWHHSAFDLRTGDVKAWSPWPPAVGKMLGALRRERALNVYPTKVKDGAIWIAIADES